MCNTQFSQLYNNYFRKCNDQYDENKSKNTEGTSLNVQYIPYKKNHLLNHQISQWDFCKEDFMMPFINHIDFMIDGNIYRKYILYETQ
jgi:hypothetical protein